MVLSIVCIVVVFFVFGGLCKSMLCVVFVLRFLNIFGYASGRSVNFLSVLMCFFMFVRDF